MNAAKETVTVYCGSIAEFMGNFFCLIHRDHIVYAFTRLNSPVINFATSALSVAVHQ